MRNTLDNSQGCTRGRCLLRPLSARLAPMFLLTTTGRPKRPFYRTVAVSLLVALLMQMWPVSYPALTQPVLPSRVAAALGYDDSWGAIRLGPHPAQAQGPGLQLSKSALPTVNQGDMLRYTLRITNTMSVTATNVVVTDTIPSLGTYTLYAPPGDGSAGISAGSGGDWYVAHPGGSDYIQWGTMDAINPVFFSGLPPGDTAELYFEVRVREPVPDQTAIINSDYGADADNAEPVPGQVITTYVNAPHWAINKEVSSSTVQPGEYLTYTITASNDGHLAASGRYTISDVIPQNTHYVSSTLPVTENGDLLTWTFDEILAVGASHVVTYVVQVTDLLTDGLSIINDTYSVTGSNVYTGAVGPPVVSTVQAPALEIAKTDHVDFIRPGDILTYTLSYSNSGGAAATGVVISDSLDANTAFVASDPAADGCAGSTCTWNLDTLPAASFGAIVVTVSVTSPLENGTLLTNMANMTSAEGYGDQAFETTTVLGTPVLHIIKEASTAVVEPGQLITYTLSYSNSGDSPALGVFITDTIDANTIFQSASPGYSDSYVWDIGTLWPSATHQLTLTVRVTDSLPANTILTNQATISGMGNISDTDQALVSVESNPILHLVKESNVDTIQPGDTLTYTIWYSNTGNAPATGVVITDTLPPELRDSQDGQQQVWNVDTVNIDSPYSITLVVTAADVITDLAHLTNLVTMSSAEGAALTATRTITVQAPELDVHKTVSPSTVKANQLVTYTITVANNGHAAAHQVRITDTLPISIVHSSVISSTSPGVVPDGGATSPPTYVWTTPVLTGQSSITLSISGRLITSPWSADGDVFTNTVEVGSDANEANSANNRDRVPATGRPGDSANITLTAAPVETTVGNTILVTATVTDAWGNPAYTGESVAFDTSLSTMIPASRMTQDGIATSSISSQQRGVAVITATTASNGLDATTVVTFTSGAPHHFAFSPSIPSPQTAGVPFSITIRVEDVYGNVVPTYTTSVSLQDSTGTMSPVSTGSGWTGGVWNGSVTITGARLNDVIAATDGLINGSSNPFEVRPGVPSALTVTVEPSSLRICQLAAVTTTITDAWGNLVPNQLVSLQVLAGPAPNGAANLSPDGGSTGSTGILNSTLYATGAGNVRIFGEKNGTTLNNVLNMPVVQIDELAIPTGISLSVAPNPLYVGGATAVATANVTDCFGPSPGQVITFTLSNSALAWFPGSSDTYTATTNASGLATAPITSNSTPLTGSVTITATVDGQYDNTVLDLQLPLSPELVITKQANPAGGDVRPGQSLVYTLVGRNVGDAQATGVVISDTLPTGVDLVSRTTSQGTFTSDSPLNVDVDTLNIGQAVTVTLQVTVMDEISGTQLNNWASIDSNETELATSTLVSHRVVTDTNTVFLPIVLNNWSASTQPQPTNANLVVENIDFVGSPPTNDGDKYHVQVTVRNIGSEAVTNDFWVDLYLNPASTPTVNQPWQYLSQSGAQGAGNCPNDPTCYGRAWYVTADLAPNGTVVLSTQMAPDQRYDRWPAEGVPYVRGRHNPIMALVDSFSAGQAYGAVYEQNETDNLSASIYGAGALPSAAGADSPAIPTWPAGSLRPSLPADQD
jgi:uncharacterized repeat protein (TIGR01451 family)